MGDSSLDVSGARVLLVDDQQANLDVLCQLLEPEGYRILMAPNGDVALRSAARAVPDLVLLDVMMPGLDGYEVCRRLKRDQATAPIPVIFITANDQTEGIVSGFQAGGVDYISKPFRNEEVLVRVRNALVTKFLFEETRSHRERLAEELRTAHRLQKGLLPTFEPHVEGISVAGHCLPADHVCGDFYQYFHLPDGRFAIGLADVTGHAMQAAIPAVLFGGMLETQMETFRGLEALLERLNRSVHRILGQRTNVCLNMVEISPGGRLRTCNAASPPALHYQCETGTVVEVRCDGSYPLGAREHTEYAVTDMELRPGDRVVLYSDGITEAEDESGSALGFEQLADVVRESGAAGESSSELLEGVLSAVAAHSGTSTQRDDQTVVVIAGHTAS